MGCPRLFILVMVRAGAKVFSNLCNCASPPNLDTPSLHVMGYDSARTILRWAKWQTWSRLKWR